LKLILFMLLLLIACSAVTTLAATKPKPSTKGLLLASQGMANALIVIPADPTPVEQTAARELADHLEQVAGSKFQIIKPMEAVSAPVFIYIGRSADVKGVDKLGQDGIIIRTEGNNLYLTGAGSRGTLYAVYTFLEDIIGCQWWTSKASFIPRKPTLTIPGLNISYSPKLVYRDPFYQDIATNPTFGARMRRNGYVPGLEPGMPAEYGGHMTIIGFCHTVYNLIPPGMYFKDHPEWFSEINGKRTADEAQLCFTNDELCKALTQSAIQRVKDNPEAGIISISQNDNQGRCQCANCRKVEEEEGSPSGPVIRFVNKVAAEIAKVDPNYMVETLAYQYTRKPPKHVKPGPNVLVRLCSVDCDFSQPLDGPKNKDFMADLKIWSSISKKMFIWDYTVDFLDNMRLHPNRQVLGRNLKLFSDGGAVGVFEQGFDAAWQYTDFIALKSWVIAHLIWNPDADSEALTKKFLKGYYGAASPYLYEYIRLTEKSISRSGKLPGFGEPDLSGIDPQVLQKSSVLFGKAENAVKGNPELTKRVRMERLALTYGKILRYTGLMAYGQANAIFKTPQEAVSACDSIMTEAVSLGIDPKTRVTYTHTLDTMMEYRKSQCMAAAATVPKECKNLPRSSWLDFQENGFFLAEIGKMVFIVDDKAASNGQAIKMTQGLGQWAIQLHANANMVGKKWHCYLVARCDAADTTGEAFQYGLYDEATKITNTLKKVPLSTCTGPEYKTFDLGSYKMQSGTWIWIAATGTPDPTAGVFVDRIFMVEEK